tara:strand:- start:3136 stop:4476 length:1341 start_codon:yes stop_codon:yes gene_type:complete
MAVKKRNKVWNGLNVVEEVDTETGVISIKSRPTRSNPDGSVLANSGADGSWSLKNETEFRTLYNNAQRRKGSQPLTEEQFRRQFNQGGVPEFNRDRAEVLNNRSNYRSVEEWNRATKSFLSAGTPLIKNRESGEANNSNGETTTITEQDERSIVESISFDPIYFNEKPISEGQANLRYPLDKMPELGYDHVTFTAYNYQAGSLISSTGEERVGNAITKISLPILPNIEESNGVDWGKDKMNIIQAKAAEIARSAIGAGDFGEGLSNLLSGTGEAAKQLLAQPGLKDAIVAHFAGQAVGANVLGRTGGAVLNPNLELLFTGPQLRTFNFAFKFRPRFKEENEEIRRIIKAFKRNMHPQRSSGEMFLLTPNIFKIKYYHDDVPHPYLNEIKPCALVNFKVNYTPDNNYMTYGDGGMTGYDVTMSFSELVPIYADEISGDGSYGGGMGF